MFVSLQERDLELRKLEINNRKEEFELDREMRREEMNLRKQELKNQQLTITALLQLLQKNAEKE